MKRRNLQISAGAMIFAIAHGVQAQEKPAPTPLNPPDEPGTLNSFFNGKLPDAIGKSKINVNARLRWEEADQNSIVPASEKEASDAVTLRTRFGLTSAPVYGFQGMLEAENITVIGPEDNFNAAGSNGRPEKTIIADPPTTELNQAWLSYSNWDSTLKGGRQRMALDNHRFVGDVAWRQNMQTYDAVSFENRSLKDVSAFYSYLWEVHRVFGDVSDLPPANHDFHSDSHLFNVSYSGWKFGKLTGYSYLLDFDNSPGNSTASCGGSFAGGYTFDKETNTRANYRAEFAWQTDYKSSPFAYGAEYYNIEASGDHRRFSLGGGYEALGSDNGQGFKTPLATLHAFNGWADVFLTPPAAGLRDLYGFAQVIFPAEIPLRCVYHKFYSDEGSADFGQEFDVIASKKLGEHWTASAKYAYYDGKDAAPPSFASPIDVQKVWVQIEFNY